MATLHYQHEQEAVISSWDQELLAVSQAPGSELTGRPKVTGVTQWGSDKL